MLFNIITISLIALLVTIGIVWLNREIKREQKREDERIEAYADAVGGTIALVGTIALACFREIAKRKANQGTQERSNNRTVQIGCTCEADNTQ